MTEFKNEESEVNNNYQNNINTNPVELNITEDDINSNIKFFLDWGIIVLVFSIIIGFTFGIILLSNSEKAVDVLIPAIGIFLGSLLIGILSNGVLKWFAYMLYTNNKKK